ncbi:maleylpyruvate isomerase family mycothiol-dependent enzyme [Nonomuraea sp. NEAU-A123]|uniref:maleylpyruvate isomerase family mycothiol-dependent enzyme n=1 Tax=Nonomuraea sp. NEAU-A123 TaxID=2839649 RepID=UPI001BE4CBD9|nr:maleylpyruvate isomerase family mycothiol-dependent enzyme [Nonomuraea sp. NEAU-A123]MBT2227311.1 maleylpyruvate isomerase family mycothiol-dependent enzyme [Nonomuraea sp. NEAU-A123]
MTVLLALQAELAAATDRFLATAASLTDDDVAAPSRLPGWSRGHVLSHMAGNADSHINLLTWARTGIETPQYPTTEARATGIEAGAGRTAAEHVAELAAGTARLAAAIRDLPAAAWQATVAAMRPPPHPAWYILVRRLREVEVHHVDLGAGYGPADWPEPFVQRELHDCLRTWPHAQSTVSEISLRGGRTWRGLGSGPAVEGGAADVLAWLIGRSDGEGVRVVTVGRLSMPVPVAPPWMTMPAPADLPATPPKDYP